LSPGISGRALRPTLGLIDPLHAASMPPRVAANTGFDILWFAIIALYCHVFFLKTGKFKIDALKSINKLKTLKHAPLYFPGTIKLI